MGRNTGVIPKARFFLIASVVVGASIACGQLNQSIGQERTASGQPPASAREPQASVKRDQGASDQPVATAAEPQATAEKTSCLPPADAMARPLIETYVREPSKLTDQRGGEFVITLRSLVASDPSVLPAVLRMAQEAPTQMRGRFGFGLGLAAKTCLSRRPAIAAQIQEAVAASGDQALIASFRIATDDTETAAVGAPAGPTGAGPIGAGGTMSFGGGAGSSLVQNPSGLLGSLSSGSGGSGSGGFGSSGAGRPPFVIIFGSVSPSRLR